MSLDNLPAGLSTQDLIHVGEIDDPMDDYDEFYEKYDNYSDDDLQDYLCERPEEVIEFLNKYKALSLDDLNELWKKANESQIESAYETRNEPDYDEYDHATDR